MQWPMRGDKPKIKITTGLRSIEFTITDGDKVSHRMFPLNLDMDVDLFIKEFKKFLSKNGQINQGKNQT
jgi:hypothetical protein